MATLIWSPLLSDARGKVGDIVFSGWKGRPYVRRRVVPANPNTALQQAIRGALALCVVSWQSFTLNEQNAWTRIAAAASVSEFNSFMGANISQERTDDWRVLTPANPDLNPIETFTVSAGAVDGVVYAYWTLGDAVSTQVVQFRYRAQEAGAVETPDGSPLTTSVLSATLSGILTGADVMLYGMVFGGSTEYSASVYAQVSGV